MTIEDPSLTDLGYQLLVLITSQLINVKSKFDMSGICSD